MILSIDAEDNVLGGIIITFTVAFSLIGLAVFTLILWRINVSYDSAFIRNELLFSCVFLCCFMISSFIVSEISYALRKEGDINGILTLYTVHLCLISTSVYIALVLCNTFLVFRAIDLNQIRQTLFADYMENKEIAEEHKTHINIYKIELHFEDIDIYSTLQDEHGLHLFMGYLMNEELSNVEYGFGQSNIASDDVVDNKEKKYCKSVEKLIFLIEAKQFLEYLNAISRSHRKKSGHMLFDQQFIAFPTECLPLSVIVHGNSSVEERNAKLKFLRFCKKYFLMQSPYHIQLQTEAKSGMIYIPSLICLPIVNIYSIE